MSAFLCMPPPSLPRTLAVNICWATQSVTALQLRYLMEGGLYGVGNATYLLKSVV